MRLLPDEEPITVANAENPSLQLGPIKDHGITTHITAPGVAVPQAQLAEAPAVAAPWARYATTPVRKPAPIVGGIYNKVEQEHTMAQQAAAEKNAEDNYSAIAKESESTAMWYDTLRELDNTDIKATGSFANIRNSAGKLLETMGYPNSGLAKDAKDLSKINNLLMQGIQSRLSTQNGVQAKDDADRERQSFAQITDPKNVFKALVKQAQAKSLRLIEKEQFYQTFKSTNGSYNGASTSWNNYIKDTPLFAMYGGKPVYYNQFIDGFLAQNKSAMAKDGLSQAEQTEKATDAWRRIAKKR
jgi:hypothetical protein